MPSNSRHVQFNPNVTVFIISSDDKPAAEPITTNSSLRSLIEVCDLRASSYSATPDTPQASPIRWDVSTPPPLSNIQWTSAVIQASILDKLCHSNADDAIEVTVSTPSFLAKVPTTSYVNLFPPFVWERGQSLFRVVYDYFNSKVASSEWQRMPPEWRNIAVQARLKHCGSDNEKKAEGIKRVDLLGSTKLFGGFEADPESDGLVLVLRNKDGSL
ncbi:unnamed protein product [Somion occarium]|uniref:DUF6699 domain-containing protein n=1 Tax=Somion occarium TaxID=3059160 RepID=A0ABP1CT97_9APHY